MGTDGRTVAKEEKHERQGKAIDPLDFSREKFVHARFVGAQIGFKQSRRGDIEVTFSVPFRYREEVAHLLSASASPLSIDVLPWTRETEHEQEADDGG